MAVSAASDRSRGSQRIPEDEGSDHRVLGPASRDLPDVHGGHVIIFPELLGHMLPSIFKSHESLNCNLAQFQE